MGHRGGSAAMRVHSPQPIAEFAQAVEEAADRRLHLVGGQATRPAFATRAHARLLHVLGWRVTPSHRQGAESHAPLKCCFVVRDGRREEAAFGYTATTVPQDADSPDLRAAQARVERLLAFLGEDRGVLLRNKPLFAFDGHCRDRIALFGGWRFQGGAWKPFLLGPSGLGGVVAQETLFARDAEPQDMARIYGHDTGKILPRVTDLVRAIEALNPGDVGEGAAAKPAAASGRLQIVPEAGGWFTAGSARPADVTQIHPGAAEAPVFRHAAHPAAALSPAADEDPMFPMFRHAQSHAASPVSTGNRYWDTEADEFRFHEFGMHRG